MDFDELKKHIKIIVQIYKKNERDPYMALWIRRLMMIILLVSAFMVYALGMTKAVLVIAVAFVFYAVCEIFSEKKYMPALDVFATSAIFAASLVLFFTGWAREISPFWALIVMTISFFSLGIRWGTVFGFILTLISTLMLNTSLVDKLGYSYLATIRRVYPLLVVAFAGISWIIMSEIQEYWLKQTNQKNLLEARVVKEKESLANISIKVVLSMYRAMEVRLPRLKDHCDKVAEISKAIAEQMGLGEEECNEVYYAGLLHDFGKVALSDDSWDQYGNVDENSDVYRQIVVKGADILKELQIMKTVELGVRYYKERYDGKGYPDGLSGNEIPMTAKIVAVANDCEKQIEEGASYEMALDYIRKHAGSLYDGFVVESALKVNLEQALSRAKQ